MTISSNPTVKAIRDELSELKELGREQARTMSPAYYTSPEFLDFEKEHLFPKEWVCVGHIGEISKPGDYYTTELQGEQLLVVRSSDQKVRVFSNVCRHRSNIVATGAGNTSRFVCSYHAWSYGSEGDLLSAPLMGRVPDFDAKKCGLHTFASEIWLGFIFVNLDGNASPLAPRLEALEPMIANYHADDRHLLYTAEDVWQTNWKSLTENFMEGYHLSATHAKTLHAITPTALCKKFPGGSGFTGYKAHYSPNCPERGPYHDDLSLEERRYTMMFCIYPSLVVAVAPHFTLYMCLRPVTVDSVAIRWGVVGVTSDRDHQVVKDYVDLCNAFNAEDRAKLELLQRGMKTRYYTVGPLAPDDYEGTIWDILQYMAGRLATEGATSA